MFLIDKYTPKTVEDAHFHKGVLEKLKVMSSDNGIPHIIFYGPEGSGKRTIINIFLEMIYDEHVHDLVDSIYKVTGSGNSTTDVVIKQSNYHIVIEPNNNNFDRYLIQDVVKAYAKRVPLGVFKTKKMFKTVLINNVDNLSYYAQTSLRRTLELYSNTCRFIMCSRALSKVIDPLRSRCFCFSISSPPESELLAYILDISSREQIKLDIETASKIIERSNRNIKKALWLLELTRLDLPFETTYENTIRIITSMVLSVDLRKLDQIRNYIYNILITNITGTSIIKDITDRLLKSSKISDDSKIKVAACAADSEYNLIRGRHDIIHLENFITNLFKIVYNGNLSKDKMGK